MLRQQEGDDNCQLALADMSSSVGSLRYKSILASRSVSILLIAICFLITAHTNGDPVGSANGK